MHDDPVGTAGIAHDLQKRLKILFIVKNIASVDAAIDDVVKSGKIDAGSSGNGFGFFVG